MAAPVVAGVAAVLRSYFPDLTAAQVKEVIMASAKKQTDLMVAQPGSGEEVPFSDLSVSGGIVNLEAAVEMALNMEGDKRKAKRILTQLPKKQARP